MRSLRELTRTVGRLTQQQRRWFASADAIDIQTAAGVPRVEQGRKVYIYAPARTAGQQGLALTVEGGAPAWQIAFSSQGKWVNPLIGWTSTADSSETVARQMYFDCKDAAIAFAEKNGWEYEVEEPNTRIKSRPKKFIGYGDNFSVKKYGIPQGGLRSELSGAAAGKKK